MEIRKIIIKHVTGEYTVEVKQDNYETVYNGIMECIKSEKNCFGHKVEGKTFFYPAELLKNSVIIFEPSEIEKQLESQKI